MRVNTRQVGPAMRAQSGLASRRVCFQLSAGLRAVAAAILKESLEAEAQALALYRELLQAVEGRSVALEEYARHMIQVEEMHAAEVDKMLRKPGDVAAYSRGP